MATEIQNPNENPNHLVYAYLEELLSVCLGNLGLELVHQFPRRRSRRRRRTVRTHPVHPSSSFYFVAVPQGGQDGFVFFAPKQQRRSGEPKTLMRIDGAESVPCVLVVVGKENGDGAW